MVFWPVGCNNWIMVAKTYCACGFRVEGKFSMFKTPVHPQLKGKRNFLENLEDSGEVV